MAENDPARLYQDMEAMIYSTKQVAAMASITHRQLEQMLYTGVIPEPSRLATHRIWTQAEADAVARYAAENGVIGRRRGYCPRRQPAAA